MLAKKQIPLEKDIQRAILDFLEYKGIYHWRQNTTPIPLAGGGFRRFVGKKGLPDVWIIMPPHGTLVACEIKRPGKNLSEDQEIFHKELVDLGGISLCVHSVEELEADLESIYRPTDNAPQPPTLDR